jgi:N-acetylglucosaminyl-diphospho-decaprenol L-rhamnosyltransferase
MKGIGAIIVTHNSEADIGPCLDAVLGRVEQVVVIDNASTDQTREQVRRKPGALLIASPENRGFAFAVNQGIRSLDLPMLLLLNPDAVLCTGVEPLAEALHEHGVAAAAGKLTDHQGRAQAGFSLRRFPAPTTLVFEVLGLNRIWKGNPVNRRYRCLDLDLDAPAEVEQPAGAFLMIRREAWQAIGGFDQGFRPVWFEDVDFLKRLHTAGYRVRYVPQAVARHRGGHSVGQLPEGSRLAFWYVSLLRYSLKHYRLPGRVGVSAAVVIRCAIGMLYGILRGWKREPLKVYGRVIWFACLRLVSGRNGEAGVTPVMAR